MRKFRALLWLNFRAMLSSFRMGGGKKRRRAASGAGALVLIAALSAYLSVTYSMLFASQLSEVGMLNLLFLLMPLVAVAMGFVFSLFAAQGIVFGGKDNDLMLSLPVSAFSLMLARTLALYLENLVVCVFVLLPAGVAYLVFGGMGGVLFFLTLLLCALFLALLPTLLSLMVGFILAFISSKFAKKAVLSNLLYLALFALLFLFMFRVNRGMAGLALAAGSIEGMFQGWGIHFLLLEQALCGGSALSLLGFLALCLLPFLLVVWLFATQYKRIITGLTARGARSDYRLGRVSAASQRWALLSKEAARFFGTPVYLFNAGLGLILLAALGVVALFQRGSLRELLGQLEGAGLTLPLVPLAAAVVCLLLAMVAITASSISLEGKQLWILKEAPVSAGGVFLVKAGFQLLLTAPCLLVGTAGIAISLSLPLWEWLFLFVAGAVFALLVALFGLYLNLCLPKLDAPNEAVVVKQSAAAMVATFGSMLAVVVLGVLWFLLHKPLGAAWALVVCLALCAAGAAVLLWLLRTKGAKLFAEL